MLFRSHLVPRSCRPNPRADQENYDSGAGPQTAGRLVALRQGWRHSGWSEDEDGVRRTFIFTPIKVDGWRSPQKPEGPSGRRCEEWTRRKKLLLPDAGIVVRDHKVPPDTRLAGSSPCLTIGVHRGQKLVVDLRTLIRGFRTPASGTDAASRTRRPAFESPPRRKPRFGRALAPWPGSMGI